MAYSVPDLPYDYAALEPHIDEQTMRVHHDKHHQAYVDKANAALEGTEWADKDVDDVLRNLDQLPDEATFEDIQHHIYVREKIERGLKDVEEGRIFTQAEVEEKMSKWLRK